MTFGRVVGLDSEWKMALHAFDFRKVSILQLASNSTVYIIDLIELGGVALLDQML